MHAEDHLGSLQAKGDLMHTQAGREKSQRSQYLMQTTPKGSLFFSFLFLSIPDAWCSVSCRIQEVSQRLKDMSDLMMTPEMRAVLPCS